MKAGKVNGKKHKTHLKGILVTVLCVLMVFFVYHRFFAPEKGELLYLRNIQKEGVKRIVIEEHAVARKLYFKNSKDIEEIIDRLHAFRYISSYGMGSHCYMEILYADGRKEYVAFDENGIWSGGNYFMGNAGYFKDLVPSKQT